MKVNGYCVSIRWRDEVSQLGRQLFVLRLEALVWRAGLRKTKAQETKSPVVESWSPGGIAGKEGLAWRPYASLCRDFPLSFTPAGFVAAGRGSPTWRTCYFPSHRISCRSEYKGKDRLEPDMLQGIVRPSGAGQERPGVDGASKVHGCADLH